MNLATSGRTIILMERHRGMAKEEEGGVASSMQLA
jgi:hypothetical protein